MSMEEKYAVEEKADFTKFGNPDEGYELDWDSEIKEEGTEFSPFESGVYKFEVLEYEKTRTKGGGKLPPCKMAKVKLRLYDQDGRSTSVYENIILHSRTEWKASQYFKSIGMKKSGEPFKMDFDGSVGKTGYADVELETYTNMSGQPRERNKVKNFLAPDDPKIERIQKGNTSENNDVPF